MTLPTLADLAPDSAGFRIVPAAFSSAAAQISVVGGRMRFSASEGGTAVFDVYRRIGGIRVNGECRPMRRSDKRSDAPRCLYLSSRGHLTRQANAGFNDIYYSGFNPLDNGRLDPAGYRAVLTIIDSAGQRSPPERADFVVV